ncbi:MAG: hypothetical protein ACOH1E_09460 [Brevundimonas sp.]
MPDVPTVIEQLDLRARAFVARIRPRHLAAALAVAVVAVGIVAVRAVAVPGPRPVLDGERIRIQVVTPPEPTVTPGAVMEVGDLVDGFEGVPSPPPTAEYAVYEPWDPEAEKPDRPALSKPQREDVVIHVPPQPEPAERNRRDGRAGRWFGFDAPEPDYRAEREARRARRDARLERDRGEREVRYYRSDGEPMEGPPDRDR